MPNREEFVKALSSSLIDKGYSPDEVRDLSETIILELKGYSISPICTTLSVIETETEKLLKLYIGTILTEGKSKNTAYAYYRGITRMLNSIEKPIKEITVFDIRIYLAQKQQVCSKASVENERAYLSAFFKWLENEEIIEKNPMNRVKPIKFNSGKKYPLTSVEIDRLRSSCEENLRDRAIIELLLSSGVRVSELGDLNKSDVNFETLEIEVRHGKGDKARTTIMGEVAKFHLKAYLESRTDSEEYLFITRNHTRITKGTVENDLRRLGAKASIHKLHPHKCRRTFATTLAKKGVSITIIQSLMGHSDINTTRRYISMDEDTVKREAMKFIE